MFRKKTSKPGDIIWGFWANQMCFVGALCLFMLSLINFHPVFAQPGKNKPTSDKMWIFFCVWAMFVSIFIMIVEYPISKRRPKTPRRSTEERPYQLELYLVHVVYYSKIFRMYFVRFAVYTAFIAPLTISFPCLLGVVFIFTGNCLYFYAGIVCREEWNPGWADKKKEVLKELAPPSQPPPRRTEVIANRGV